MTSTTPTVRLCFICSIPLPQEVLGLRSIEALQAKMGMLSVEAQSKLEKDTAKKEAKAEAKAEATMKKKMVRLSCLAAPLSLLTYT